jgi:DNA-binding NtrC family response regulator
LKKLTPELLEVFMQRNWEGNVREMENYIMQGILFSPEDQVRPQDMGLGLNANRENIVDISFQDMPYKKAKEQVLVNFNASYIKNLLTKSKGNVTQAARLCGLERQALQQIMRRYGIKADRYRNPDRATEAG